MSLENNATQSDTDSIGMSCGSSEFEAGTVDDEFSEGESVENLRF